MIIKIFIYLKGLICISQNFPNIFGQPLVCLLSPEQLPINLQGLNILWNYLSFKSDFQISLYFKMHLEWTFFFLNFVLLLKFFCPSQCFIHYKCSFCLYFYFVFLVLDHQVKGNLFTLFLHSPLMALCSVCDIADVPAAIWDKCQGQVDKFISDASRLFSRARKLGKSSDS